MTMIGVRAKADITGHKKMRKTFLQGLDGGQNRIEVVVAHVAGGILFEANI